MKNSLRCPVCAGELKKDGARLVCPQGHSFDAAKEGYVHLLPSAQMRAASPGDDGEMVRARNRFLNGGYYRMLSDEICRLTLEVLEARPDLLSPVLLDCGCGDGYYTAALTQAIFAANKTPSVIGVDISKAAVRLAARRERRAMFIVGSVFRLPIADHSVDFLLNCFSPVCPEEFCRVLAPGGTFLHVTPGPEHLWGLKSVLYDRPYPNPNGPAVPKGFVSVCEGSVEGRIHLPRSQDISDLFTMTPYRWKTDEAGKARLNALMELDTEVAFHWERLYKQ